MVQFRLEEGQIEGLRNAVTECDTDQPAGIVSQASNGLGRDRTRWVDEISFAFAVGGVVNTDGITALEGLDCGLDAAGDCRGITAVRQRPSPPFRP
jgi:hypothetical protein